MSGEKNNMPSTAEGRREPTLVQIAVGRLLFCGGATLTVIGLSILGCEVFLTDQEPNGSIEWSSTLIAFGAIFLSYITFAGAEKLGVSKGVKWMNTINKATITIFLFIHVNRFRHRNHDLYKSFGPSNRPELNFPK